MKWKIVEKLRLFVSAKLGRCPRCMRWALRGAVITWAAVIVVHYLSSNLWYWFLPLPVSFTALWCLHIATFGRRAVRAATNGETRETVSDALTRRKFLRFARAAAFAVSLSAVLPKLAKAQACDPGWGKCRGIDVCCPPGYHYYCSHNQCKKDQTFKCYEARTEEALANLKQCCDGDVFVTCG
jgi:hypothetical protein